MIAIAKSFEADANKTTDQDLWQTQFLNLLHAIRRHAQFCFRHLEPDAREEAVQEVIANALVAYLRLVQLGRESLAYAGPLATYAVAQVREGRQVGGKLKALDVTSSYCQRRKGIRIERLDRFDDRKGQWREMVVEDRTATPAEIATTRIDFQAWLNTLSRRDRKIAETLATGEDTKAAARTFGISAARVSQIRRELHDAWRRFQGEMAGELLAAGV